MTNQISLSGASSSLSGASDVRPKLSSLIQNMCPNGVEFKTLGEVCEMKRGSTITANQAEDGNIPVIAGGQKPAYFHNQCNREGKNITVAGSGAYAGYVAYWEQPIFVSDAFTVTPKEASLDIKFVYYFLTNIQDKIYHTKKGSGVPHVHPSSIADFEIPLPPIEIQKKIVECLDEFSALAAELQAELQLRRKQYEYYRTQLLTPHSDCNSADKPDDAQWEWKTLGEICEINRGVRVVKNELEKEGKYPVYQNSLTPLGYYDKSNYPANTTFVISAGAAGKVGFSDVDFWAADDCLCLTCPDMLMSKFLYYQLMEKQDYFLSQVRHASVPRLSRTVVESFKIPLPSLAEQARIVAILDKFEKLITSMEEGIPAEQIRQQKRYEHFRDLLLTFDRKAE